MKDLANWKVFWVEVVTMWRKEHGFIPGNLLKFSPIITLVGIVGILATSEPWKTYSWYLLVAGGFVMLFSLRFVFPYRKWKVDTDVLESKIHERAPAYDMQQATEQQPFRFLTIEPYRGLVEKDGEGICLVGFVAHIRSWFFKPITIEKVQGILGIGVKLGDFIPIEFELDTNSKDVPVSGLRDGKEYQNYVNFSFRWYHQKITLPASYKDILCFAVIQKATVTTKELGNITLTAIDGYIHLDWWNPQSPENIIKEHEL